jgi:hypothetical protein
MPDCCDPKPRAIRILDDIIETGCPDSGPSVAGSTFGCCAPEIERLACCGSGSDSRKVEQLTKPPWVAGVINSPAGPVPQVATRWTREDYKGSWTARWGAGRMNYMIAPGLYAAGTPDQSSPVFASANYKMSFDHLRRALDKMNAWILVLDTKGINVWCAAGKGTFGTADLVRQLARCRLAEIVSHRSIIVPQLGAPGIAAHEVKRHSGFRVIYGPVRAQDIPAFISSGNKATRDMRTVRFDTRDRLVLTPIELYNMKTPLMWLAVVLLLLQLIGLLQVTWAEVIPILGAILAGAVVAPVLLPIIPGRLSPGKDGWWVCFGRPRLSASTI